MQVDLSEEDRGLLYASLMNYKLELDAMSLSDDPNDMPAPVGQLLTDIGKVEDLIRRLGFDPTPPVPPQP